MPSYPTFSIDNGVGITNVAGDTKIGVGIEGLKIEYDLDTSEPKSFTINKYGINFQDAINNFTTLPGRLAAVGQAFQSVELPPNDTTLKINNTVLVTDGISSGTFGLNDINTEINSSNELILNSFGPIEMKTNSVTALSINSSQVCEFTYLPTCLDPPSNDIQLVNKAYVDKKLTKLNFYDEQWNVSSNTNPLGFYIAGTGSGTTLAVNAEENHYGIVRLVTPNLNANSTWVMRCPLIWSNIDYFEVVFRGWSHNTSNNTTLSVGLLNNVNSLNTSAVTLMYSNNIAPTGVWNMIANSVSVGSFTGTLATQNVNVWLKIRVTNTDDSGSFMATLTRLDTNISETIHGSGINTGVQFHLGGGVSCIIGGVSKTMDFDSFELQLK